MQAEEINTNSLNSSVVVISDVNNTTTILANDPEVATVEQLSRAFSTVDVFYENINIGQGGEINLQRDRASVGNINTSIGITSNSMALAQATANNDTAVNSFANNKISLRVTGDRPGAIVFDVDGGVNFNNINSGANTNAFNDNDLDAEATSEGENSIANASTSDRFGNDSLNQITFDSEINFALISLNLNLPDVNYVINQVPEIYSSNIKLIALDTCPVNAGNLNRQSHAIET